MHRRRCLSALCACALGMSCPAALPAACRSDFDWDVVVVGSGLAGHCAALSARMAGAERVLMLEKAAITGGHSALASGSIAFVDPRRQAAQGIEDSVEKFLADALEVGGAVDEAMVRFMAEESASGIDWLQSLGVRFSPKIFSAHGGAHPRCLTAFGNMGARRYIFELHRRCQEYGVRTRLLSKLEALSRPEPGQKGLLLEVLDERTGERSELRAASVVLATGGFSANLALRMRFRPELNHEIPTTANPHGLLRDTATGDGLLLARSLGAAWTDMSSIVLLSYWGGRMLDYMGAEIYVDEQGRRFVDETAATSRIAEAIAGLPSRSMFVITDAKSVKGVNVGAKIAAGSVHRSGTIAEMARAIGVPADVLEQTVAQYNKHARSGEPDAFGRTVFLQTIEAPPFYWGRERLMVHATLGGLRTDRNSRVLDAEGNPIEGLFAAGEVAGGIWGRDRLGGTGLLQCLVQGRRAGSRAARSI